MTREDLETCVAIQTKYLWDGGLNFDAARETILAAIDKYMKSQRVCIPAPKLKWEYDETSHCWWATVLGNHYAILYQGSSAVVWHNGKLAYLDGEKWYPNDQSEDQAKDRAVAHWQSIWNKEVGADVVPAANIELHPINSGLSEAEQKAIMLEAIKQWKSGPIQFVPAADPFAGIDLDCEHFEDLPPSIMDNPVFSAYWNAANSHLEVGDSIWDAFKKWAEKYRSGGKQNG